MNFDFAHRKLILTYTCTCMFMKQNKRHACKNQTGLAPIPVIYCLPFEGSTSVLILLFLSSLSFFTYL